MKTKFILGILVSLMLSFVVGSFIAAAFSVAPAIAIGGCIALSALVSFAPPQLGVLRMGLLKELWTGELIDKFRYENLFLSRIPSANQFVNNNAVHIADIGADPEVLINNTTYPIPAVTRTDEDVSIALDKFDTENTKITDDELYALPYDKPGSVIRQHREVLEEKTAEKSAHSLAPSVSSAVAPIIQTTGASNAETYARKRLTPTDVIKAKRTLDDLKVPRRNRLLVLCPAHVEDLLLLDEKFALQYKNMRTGDILAMYGFDIYEFPGNPSYALVNAVLTKKAFGAAAATTDQAASLFFYADRAVQCRGDVNMYYSKAEQDPSNRQSLVGFRVYHLCLPKKVDGFGAIVAATT